MSQTEHDSHGYKHSRISAARDPQTMYNAIYKSMLKLHLLLVQLDTCRKFQTFWESLPVCFKNDIFYSKVLSFVDSPVVSHLKALYCLLYLSTKMSSDLGIFGHKIFYVLCHFVHKMSLKEKRIF